MRKLSGSRFPLIGDRFLEEQTGQNTIDMIYYPDVNEYNGTRTLQAIIKNYKFR